MIRLIQIPFSHNCIKVRRALELKGLDYETTDIQPMDRAPVVAASGQWRVPALVDGERRVHESTAILRYLEERSPEPSLLPVDPARRAECWLLEDWADASLMELSRRIAYWQAIETPGAIEQLWFPELTGIKRRLYVRQARKVLCKRFGLSAKRNRYDEQEALRLAALAVERLGDASHLFGERPTVADLGWASMSLPLRVAAPAVRDDPAVKRLLEWGAALMAEQDLAIYDADRLLAA